MVATVLPATYAGLKDDLADGGRVRVVEAKGSESYSLNCVWNTIVLFHRKHMKRLFVAGLNEIISSYKSNVKAPSLKDLAFRHLQYFAIQLLRRKSQNSSERTDRCCRRHISCSRS